MATEEDAVNVQSSVQYKKFDNDDVSEVDKTSEIDLGSTDSASTAVSAAPISEQPQAPNQPLEGAVVNIVQNGGAATQPQPEIVLNVNGIAPPGGLVHQEEEWKWMNLVLSICSIFCCTVCGILATVTSVLAYIDHRVKDYESARSKKIAAYALALTALVAGVICMVVVIVVAVHYDKLNHGL